MQKLVANFLCCIFLFFASVDTGYSQTMSFGDAVEVWALACGKDVDIHCKGIKPGNEQLTACLIGKASPICQKATTAFQINMDARFQAQAKAQKTCRNDVKRLCPGFRKGQARVLRCLLRKDNFRAASVPCKNTLQAAGWLDEVSKKAN
ncbi:MAG: hypothetical protein GY742_22160 [Hyphomicrobiales bacterium]|nr:hypothetical protein [Hyphomicrobiales bacterium]